MELETNNLYNLLNRIRNASRSDAWTLEEAVFMLVFNEIANAGIILPAEKYTGIFRSSYDFIMQGIQKGELQFIDKCTNSIFAEIIGTSVYTLSKATQTSNLTEIKDIITRGLKAVISIPPHQARAISRFWAAKMDKKDIQKKCLDSQAVRKYAQANGRGLGAEQHIIATIIKNAEDRTNAGAKSIWDPRDKILKQVVYFMDKLVSKEIGCRCRHDKLAAIAYAFAKDESGIMLHNYDCKQYGLREAFKDLACNRVPPERQFGKSSYKSASCLCPIPEHNNFKIPVTKRNRVKTKSTL